MKLITSSKDMECNPFRTNKELLNYMKNPFSWNLLVVPLKERSGPRSLGENFGEIDVRNLHLEERWEGKVIVCHDMMGNYRNDRFVEDTSKFDDYRFYHWPGIDVFIYFSHEFITIPPIQWINVAHEHGVKILGTFITEHISGQTKLLEILESTATMRVASDGLVLLAKLCNFDGWFFNVECSLPEEKMSMLKAFVVYLREQINTQIPGGLVIWYDSITREGNLAWQNELNRFNKTFFDASDGIFLNYGWTLPNLMRSRLALRDDQNEKREYDVYVGIDVFGRGQIGKLLTFETFADVKEQNYSIAIFAPGWTFESFSGDLDIKTPTGDDNVNKYFLEKDNFFWSKLWQHMNSHGITTLPFYTSFCMGSGKTKKRHGAIISAKPWFNLSEQQLQPSVPGYHKFSAYFTDAFDGGSCLKMNEADKLIRIFTSDFTISQEIGFIASFALKRIQTEFEIDLHLIVLNADTREVCEVICTAMPYPTSSKGRKYLEPVSDPTLREMHMLLKSSNQKCISTNSPINDWETRFFYVHLGADVRGTIVDIGVRVWDSTGLGLVFDRKYDDLLLGAMSFHNGVFDETRLHEFTKIQASDFVPL